MKSSTQWFIGDPPTVKVPGAEEFSVYLGPKLLDTIAFIGFEDSASSTGMRCTGTGFFLFYEGDGYLVTARHVAEPIGEDPFVIRINRRGRAELLRSDLVNWSFHPDPTVDLAAIRLVLPVGHGYECQYLLREQIITEDQFFDQGVGVGSLSYTLGLFRFIYGQNRNLPMVHAGNVALLPPSGERIPVYNKLTQKTDFVQGYLIESAAIDGASGSPVFVRPSITTEALPTNQGSARASWPEARVYLLGLFQGAWFAPPDAPLAQNVRARTDSVVPVGVGVVVPSYQIIELLETKEMRDQRTKNEQTDAARPTAVSVEEAPPATYENPTHREDFMRLADVAARKRRQDD